MGNHKAAPRSGTLAPPVAAGRPGRMTPLLAKALLSTLLLTGMAAAGTYALSDGWAKSGDDVSPTDARMRLETFRALDALVASKVPADDLEQALHDMRLSATAQQSLRADLGLAVSPQVLARPSATSAAEPAAKQQAQPEAQRVKLIWIRLWDTDAEDGDVVRIDSAGYSRVVRLTKHGDTFAVPVSGDDVIRVTGIKDGDGGGITVGLASGSSRAVFPIMSEGQVLGLKVRVD